MSAERGSPRRTSPTTTPTSTAGTGINLVRIEQVVSALAKARDNGKGVSPPGHVHLRGIFGARKTPQKVAQKRLRRPP